MFNDSLPENRQNSNITTSLCLAFQLSKTEARAIPLHAVEAIGERRYSSYSISTSDLDGSEWSASRPCRALPPGKGPPVSVVQEAGWALEPVWTEARGKPFRLCQGSNLDRPVVQPVYLLRYPCLPMRVSRSRKVLLGIFDLV
jgi:hypothetical protein